MIQGTLRDVVVYDFTGTKQRPTAYWYIITWDATVSGKEFADHESIAKKFIMAVYFAHPYHSWERGLNENTNGLLRQYFPKGSCFEKVTEVEVQLAVDSLNHRPRKILGFKTTFEVFFGKTMRYNSSPLGVALRS